MKQYLLICALLLGLCVQAQDYHTTIEIAHPARFQLRANTVNVLLVNNTVAHPDAPLAAFFTLMGASEAFDDYAERIPSVLERTQNTSPSIYRKRFLNAAQIDSLLAYYHADALIVLNQLLLRTETESFLTIDNDYAAILSGNVSANWSIYYSGQEQGRVFNTQDSLFWIGRAMSETEALSQLPDEQQANNELAVECGRKLADKLSEQREIVDRYLYEIQNDDAGMLAFRQQHWLQAIQAWRPIVETGDGGNNKQKKQAAHAAANMAVAYEIIGDLSSAVFYAQKSEIFFGDLSSSYARQQQANMRYYQERLQDRMAELIGR